MACRKQCVAACLLAVVVPGGSSVVALQVSRPGIGFTCPRERFAGVMGFDHGLLFPWDSVPADLSSGGFTKATCPKAVVYMDWEAWTFSPADPAFEFIAMARTKDDISKLASYMPHNKATKLAFLNEPDYSSTALDVKSAVALWRQYAVPYQKQGISLLSPAVTSDRSKGLPWLKQFMGNVSDVRPNYIALHYYGSDSSDFTQYVASVYNLFKLPIYITEVASTSSNLKSVQTFMTNITTWSSQQSYMKGVFWFASSRNANNGNLAQSALMSSTGSRTALGTQWCTV